MVSWRHSCFLIGVICSVSRMTCTTKVSEVDCPNGVTGCSAHSACGPSGKCECSAGYGEDKTDGSTCVKFLGTSCQGSNTCTGLEHSVCLNSKCACAENYKEKNDVCTLKKVSEVTCSNNGAECTGIANSICKSTQCSCSTGYSEDLTDGSTCVQAGSCTGTGPCTNKANSICDSGQCKCKDGFTELTNTCEKVFGSVCHGSDPCTGLEHSVCLNGKCACADNYKEKNAVCTLTVSGITCSAQGTECDKIANAECGAKKCKCSDGFVMNVDVCAPENTAATLKIGAATLVLFAILTVLQIIG